MKILGIIPSRYASSRFPGKPLVDIGGKTMIRRVFEQACLSQRLTEVIVATDDERIANEVRSFGGRVQMTKTTHLNGTERCAEVLSHFPDYAYAVNIQGDEPFIHPEQIDTLAALLDGSVQLATLVKPISDPALLTNPNTMKVIFNRFHEALYFSRTCIPYLRDVPPGEWLERHTFYKHIGLYAYRSDILYEITSLPPSTLELAESLEQLRWLENGYRIKVGFTTHESVGIDAPADLDRAIQMFLK